MIFNNVIPMWRQHILMRIPMWRQHKRMRDETVQSESVGERKPLAEDLAHREEAEVKEAKHES